jgi:hypothetical protein
MSEAKTPWFEVDKDGLRKQAKERGPAHVLLELIANSLDERQSGMTEIHIMAQPVEGKPLVKVTVEDNSPRGYGSNLHHAYTLFAPSYKRSNAEQSGQFNFGCKLWLSLCREARVSTVSGTVEFDAEGHRSVNSRRKRHAGTVVEGVMEMTREEFSELQILVKRLILPGDVEVTFNGTLLTSRTPVKSFTAKLTTKIAGVDGVMQSVQRETTVDLYEPVEGTRAMLYELAVPVVETDIRWDVQIGQKVPLNKDRDNVTPAYLREVKRIVAERMSEMIDRDDAAGWCNDVLGDAKASAGACEAIIRGRFGDNAAIYDPSDPEANINWQTQRGGELVRGGHLTGEQWANVRRYGLLKPTGQLAPSPKPYSDDPDAPPATFYDVSELTPGMIAVRSRAYQLAGAIGVNKLQVLFAKDMAQSVLACYRRLGSSTGEIQFNVPSLGEDWFADANAVAADELIIHELAHHFVSSHTHPEQGPQGKPWRFHDACCHVAARSLDLTRSSHGEDLCQGGGPC